MVIVTYNPGETMFTDETRNCPLSSIRGNNYQMVVHKIDSNSTLVEAMKNRTEGEMILAIRQALKRMQLQGITRRHQVLNNKISEAYKNKIRGTNMTY